MSTSTAIQLKNLTKHFGQRNPIRAVDGVDLSIEAGQVYGFLGPNGAGKSTTIRMMLDLVTPTVGEVLVFGQPVESHHDVLRRVGSLVEGAAFYHFLTGRKNLEVLARTGGYHDSGRIDELLGIVGLAQRASQKVAGYSMGMKQRLGLAAALLGNPDLVILDEPTNGLDPIGMHEMRGLIRSLVDEHSKTVFLSSHLLGEVEQTCDRVAIINKGKIIREGTVDSLLDAKAQLRIEAQPLDKAQHVLKGRWPVVANGHWLTVEASRDDTPNIVSLLTQAGIAVFQVTSERQSLEAYFLQVTEGQGQDEVTL